MDSDWRNELATEQQKDKLRFFGCTWDEGITAGQASDALEECARRWPDVQAAYQHHPTTTDLPDGAPSQKATIQVAQRGRPPKQSLTYDETRRMSQEEWNGWIALHGSYGTEPGCELTFGKARGMSEKEWEDWKNPRNVEEHAECVQGANNDEQLKLATVHWYPPEPKPSDPKYQAWDNAAGREYGFALDHLRWKESVKQIKAQIETEKLSQPKRERIRVELTQRAAKQQDEKRCTTPEHTPLFIPPTPDQLAEIRSFGKEPPPGLTYQEAAIWIEQCKILYSAKPQNKSLQENTIQKAETETIQDPCVSDNPVAQSVNGEKIFKAWTDEKKFVKPGYVLIFSEAQHWWLITAVAYRKFVDVKITEVLLRPPGGAILELHELLKEKALTHRDRRAAQEVTIQEAAKPQNTSPSQYTIPARVVQDYPPSRPLEHTYTPHGFCKNCGWERSFIEKTQRACLTTQEDFRKIRMGELTQKDCYRERGEMV